MRRDLEDEVGVQGGRDQVQQWEGVDGAAAFRAGSAGWVMPARGGQLDLGLAESEVPFTDGLAEQVGTLGLGALAVFVSAAALPGEVLVGRSGGWSCPDASRSKVACAGPCSASQVFVLVRNEFAYLPAKVAGAGLAESVGLLGERARRASASR